MAPFIRPLKCSRLPPKSVAILILRNDLRLDDNPALNLASTASQLLPLYIFDTRDYPTSGHKSAFGFDRIGPFRSRFIKEAVDDLRKGLVGKGSGLLIQNGESESCLAQILDKLKASTQEPIHVIITQSVGTEEASRERALEQTCKSKGAQFHSIWSGTLHYPEDLPFVPGEIVPDFFTQYRKLVEKDSRIRDPVDCPSSLPPLPQGFKGEAIKVDSILSKMHPAEPATGEYDQRSMVPFPGGYTPALNRLNAWIFSADSLETYKRTRNESGLLNCSSKFSPFLAHGCISPRTIYNAIARYESERVKNEDTYWLVFELMTRDYWIWTAARYKQRLFCWNGYSKGHSAEWSAPTAFTQQHKLNLKSWIDGMTGVPFVDAAMREMKATGYMSNRSRQNVASFLIHELDIPDWRVGAEYFESILVDHDVAANWCNWAYIAGVGSDPRGGRRFNTVKQGRDYDTNARFTKLWCPELAKIPQSQVFEPWKMRNGELRQMGVTLGCDYPVPVIEMSTFVPKGEYNGPKPDEGQNSRGHRRAGRGRKQQHAQKYGRHFDT